MLRTRSRPWVRRLTLLVLLLLLQALTGHGEVKQGKAKDYKEVNKIQAAQNYRKWVQERYKAKAITVDNATNLQVEALLHPYGVCTQNRKCQKPRENALIVRNQWYEGLHDRQAMLKIFGMLAYSLCAELYVDSPCDTLGGHVGLSPNVSCNSTWADFNTYSDPVKYKFPSPISAQEFLERTNYAQDSGTDESTYKHNITSPFHATNFFKEWRQASMAHLENETFAWHIQTVWSKLFYDRIYGPKSRQIFTPRIVNHQKCKPTEGVVPYTEKHVSLFWSSLGQDIIDRSKSEGNIKNRDKVKKTSSYAISHSDYTVLHVRRGDMSLERKQDYQVNCSTEAEAVIALMKCRYAEKTLGKSVLLMTDELDPAYLSSLQTTLDKLVGPKNHLWLDQYMGNLFPSIDSMHIYQFGEALIKTSRHSINIHNDKDCEIKQKCTTYHQDKRRR